MNVIYSDAKVAKVAKDIEMFCFGLPVPKKLIQATGSSGWAFVMHNPRRCFDAKGKNLEVIRVFLELMSHD